MTLTDLKTRIESGDLHFLDGLVLLGTIASQRWFGGKSRDVLDARVLDAGVVPAARRCSRSRSSRSATDCRPTTSTTCRSASGRATTAGTSRSIAEAEGWIAYDALADPELVRRIVELVRAGEPLDLGEATIVFCPYGTLPDEVETVRPMGAEQSNSSLVLDEQLALKFYRRIEPGMNPELEVLRFLTYRKFPHVAALEGYVTYEGRPLEATLAILQRFVPSHGDAWELALETLGSDPGWLPAHARRLGEVTAKLHNTLASDPTDPHFAPEEPSTESLALLSATIDEEIEQVFAALPDIAGARAGGRARRGGARPAPHAHAHRAGRQDHPPPRRLPPRPGAVDERGGLADPRLRGRARALALRAAAEALAAARRRRHAALVRLRGVGLA